LNKSKRRHILNEGTNIEILWLFLKEDLELRTQIEYHLNDGYKISAIKCLKHYAEDKPQGKSDIYKNSNLREIKDTIDRYAIRYNITKKLDQLRNRIEKWCIKNGHDNMGYQKEVKDNKTGEYTYRYSDWEFIDDQHGLMINDWDWLPVSKQMRLYNTLWKQYKY
jgi:hypothetical protein